MTFTKVVEVSSLFIHFHGDANQESAIHNKTTDKKRTQKLQYNIYANWFPLQLVPCCFHPCAWLVLLCLL